MAPGDGSVLRIGLDYAGVRAGLELAGVDMTRTLWDDIRLIESGAITAHVEAGAE